MKKEREKEKLLYESSVMSLCKSTSLPKYDQNCCINTQELEQREEGGYYVRFQLVWYKEAALNWKAMKSFQFLNS